MNKNKKELIIESFQKMDSTMLEILLDDNKTYQDAAKDIFLEKLNKAFSEFKEKGDTFLFSHKGFCNSDECNNKGCSGYSFVGNNSKNYVDFIFQETENEINDIFHCNGFEITGESIETNNSISIFIKNDEKADFKPSIDFLIKSQKCKLAYEELIHFQNTAIDKEVYLVWLEKFYPLYKSFDLPPIFYAEFDKFYWLYSRINELKDFLQSNKFAIKAIKEFQSIDKSNEKQLLIWLTKYEQTGNNLTLFLYEDIDFEQPEKNKYFKVDNLKIDTSDFKHIAKFKFLFDEHYWEMLEKYSTFSKEETTRYINENDEMSKYISSLSYHLDKKGIQL
ncbi:MAG: hypothetical protein JSS64_11880 [Bacteroidetes bacterium]|nr:hypothetical protein [Bacteroidota bacterium]